MHLHTHIKKKNHLFKKYDLLDKFLFQQLVVNFVDFWRNNSMLMKKKIAREKAAG